jgi:uncharacterized membrane protein
MPIDPKILHNVPIFQLLDKDELKDLSSYIDEGQFGAGQTVFKKGEPGGTMYVVISGRVETFIMDEDGERVVLETVGPGQIFGELSIFDGEPRSASAIALEPTRTAIIDRSDLSDLFAKRPHAALDVLTVLSQRIRRTDHLLSQRVARNPNTVIEETASFGDRVADLVARFGGSWSFINLFTLVMVVWIGINTWWMIHPFDPPPFIGLNLILSMLAALQAPVIMMSQNRQDAKDRVRSELDYQVNLKAEVEIMELHGKVDKMKDELLELLERINGNGTGKNGPSARA